jgi:hypothetical protein
MIKIKIRRNSRIKDILNGKNAALKYQIASTLAGTDNVKI